MEEDVGASPTKEDYGRQRMEAVWIERANRLSQPLTTEAEQRTWPVIVLGIGKERYGIELQDVAEVLAHVSPSPVPGPQRRFRESSMHTAKFVR